MTQKRKAELAIIGIALAIFIAGFGVGAGTIVLLNQPDPYEYHDEGMWQVEQGDTLWEIADFYSDNRHDIRRVINIIKQLNPGLTAKIYSGQQIFVPLFECMDWEYYSEE